MTFYQRVKQFKVKHIYQRSMSGNTLFFVLGVCRADNHKCVIMKTFSCKRLHLDSYFGAESVFRKRFHAGKPFHNVSVFINTQEKRKMKTFSFPFSRRSLNQKKVKALTCKRFYFMKIFRKHSVKIFAITFMKKVFYLHLYFYKKVQYNIIVGKGNKKNIYENIFMKTKKLFTS